jgi:hypothetical protein
MPTIENISVRRRKLRATELFRQHYLLRFLWMSFPEFDASFDRPEFDASCGTRCVEVVRHWQECLISKAHLKMSCWSSCNHIQCPVPQPALYILVHGRVLLSSLVMISAVYESVSRHWWLSRPPRSQYTQIHVTRGVEDAGHG